ncbi:translesion DNA synthesis-associated protein ImuA [Variovorax sp. PCZ-1]|uniref:translesion DNA synthesis-associated protein ImuA n=1 Tax=Variovorax sp. PCZ-1 TaxID=2835533 RepID=UPI001BD16242|nr:translesion DNA synthesis-associated protein ImuA [Variovorax sp. PCZ-1]MBS7806144.1 translesion DNA synthesis-associated protein ImuA [Variovorax sp. PCZ-1]
MSALATSDLSSLFQGNKIWHARELLGTTTASSKGLSTGSEALDSALPAGGWPEGQLTELICAQGSSGEWSLILPGLLSTLTPKPTKRSPKLVLINPPFEPYLLAWGIAGISPGDVLRVDSSAHAQAQQRACWAAEQALHCSEVAAVIAWLPRAPTEALRRLQLAASQSQVLLFVVRPLTAREHSSPASLRMVLTRLDALHAEVEILKCRGSAGQVTVQIDLLSPSFRALLQARKRRSQTAPSISTTSQTSPVFRMTPRSQVIGLLPDHLLFGNERAAEGPAMSVKAHHGLDCTPTVLPPLIHIPKINSPQPASNIPERALKRAARHARSR